MNECTFLYCPRMFSRCLHFSSRSLSCASCKYSNQAAFGTGSASITEWPCCCSISERSSSVLFSLLMKGIQDGFVKVKNSERVGEEFRTSWWKQFEKVRPIYFNVWNKNCNKVQYLFKKHFKTSCWRIWDHLVKKVLETIIIEFKKKSFINDNYTVQNFIWENNLVEWLGVS